MSANCDTIVVKRTLGNKEGVDYNDRRENDTFGYGDT